MTRTAHALMSLALAALTGCYAYSYTPVTPAPGSRIALDLNDVGRAQLRDNIGPEVLRVEGVLVSAADSQYVVRVDRTVGFRGEINPWAGEPVTLRFGYVGLMRERKFSAGRTVVAVGGFSAAVVAFIATRNLVGGSSGGTTGPPGGGNNGQ